jgi:hypothetical protein
VVNKAKAKKTGVYVSTLPVAPAKASNNSWHDDAHDHDQPQVVSVLPPYNLILCQVTDISDTRLAAWLNNHPPNV